MSNDTKGLTWGNFFAFKNMISLFLVKIIYVIGIVIITSIGVVTMVGGCSGCFSYQFGGAAIFLGLAIIFVGNLAWRVACEWWVVFFSMHEMIVKIEENTNSDKAGSENINSKITGGEVQNG